MTPLIRRRRFPRTRPDSRADVDQHARPTPAPAYVEALRRQLDVGSIGSVPVLPTTAATRARMSRQRARNTSTELALRQQLHRLGLRYRVHRRPLPEVRREADVLFGPSRVAVFVDGCFWHGCPEHATWPRSNAEFWRTKIEGNRLRDADTDKRLAEAGWAALRVWEHEDPVAAARRVRDLVATRRPG